MAVLSRHSIEDPGMSTNFRIVCPRIIALIFLVNACSSPQVIEVSSFPTPVNPTMVQSPMAISPTFTTSPMRSNSPPPTTVRSEPTSTIQPSTESQPTAIFSDECIDLTDAAFDEFVLKSPIPVIVHFWAPWCGPCKLLAPILNQLAEEYAGKLRIARVNTDENPEWAMKLGVHGIPTLLFFLNGEVVHRQVGALSETMLREVVDQFLEYAVERTPIP